MTASVGGCPRSARAWRARVSSRASSLRGAQYIALDVRAHHPHDVRRGRRAPRARAPAGRARRVAGRQARREHRRRPGRDAHGRRALGAVGPHRRHGRYAGIGFRSAAPSTSRAERSAERREERPPPSTREPRPPPVARRPPLSTSTARLSREGDAGRRVGTFSGSMTSHFFATTVFFLVKNKSFFYTDERMRRARERVAFEPPRERLTRKHTRCLLITNKRQVSQTSRTTTHLRRRSRAKTSIRARFSLA